MAPPHRPSTAASMGDTHRPSGTWGAVVGGTPGCIPHPAPQTQHPGSVFAREVGVGAHGGTRGDMGDSRVMAHGSVPLIPLAELHQVHSTPVLIAGPSHFPATGIGGEWGADFGLAARQPQQRGHEGDTSTAVMDSRDPRVPLFSSPKPRRGSTSLASGVTRSPVTPPRPPHAWHPPVTR